MISDNASFLRIQLLYYYRLYYTLACTISLKKKKKPHYHISLNLHSDLRSIFSVT